MYKVSRDEFAIRIAVRRLYSGLSSFVGVAVLKTHHRKMSVKSIYYSDKYFDEMYEYR